MPPVAPTYRIGPSDFFTSDDLVADANTLNEQMNALDNQDWARPTQSLFDGWNAFLQEWRGFYRSTFFNFFGAGWNNGNRDELVQFETRFGTFAAQYTQESGNSLPGGVVAPSAGTKDTLGDHLLQQVRPLAPSLPGWAWVLIGVAIVAGLAWYFFRGTIMRIAARTSA